MSKLIPILLVIVLFCACKPKAKPVNNLKIRAWNILTDHTPTAYKTLAASADYPVNQLQLSHDICQNLKDVKFQWNRNIVNGLTTKAHKLGIPEVLVWDHALYDLDYYPDRFKVNNTTQIDLDNPKFWKWFKRDYRKMLSEIPDVDGIVLTFAETGACIENQYSEQIKLPEEKLAALVDSVAAVVVKERNLKLYLRSSANEHSNILKMKNCFHLIKTPGIVVMVKETPDDSFVIHPVSRWIKDIPLPVIVEFDCAHEYNGQGIVASVFPETHLKHWQYYQTLPNVIGYSLYTDCTHNTSIIGTPAEINLYAISKASQNPELGINEITEGFIAEKFDSAAIEYLKPIFELAPEIILSSFYTLGLNTTNHSEVDFHYKPIYAEYATEAWLDNPEITIAHTINQHFHYWSDIVNHLAPAPDKLAAEVCDGEPYKVFAKNWLQPEELMDSTYLSYILAEKKYGVQQAKKAMQIINEAKVHCNSSENFNTFYHTFNRTLMSAKLRKAYAQVYYAQRVWNRGEAFQKEYLRALISDGLDEMLVVADEMTAYRRGGATGEYNWKNDANIALRLVDEVRGTSMLAEK